jgi:hypothetical protein
MSRASARPVCELLRNVGGRRTGWWGQYDQVEYTDVVQDPLCYDFFQQLTWTFEGNWSVALRLP